MNIYSTYKNDVPPMEWQAATSMWFEPMLQASTSQQPATRPSRQGTDCVQAGRCFVNTLGIIASIATGEPMMSVGGGKRTKKHKKHKRSKSKRSKSKRSKSKRSKSKRSKSKRSKSKRRTRKDIS